MDINRINVFFIYYSTDLFMAMFYNTIIAWSVSYFFRSFHSNLAWKNCNGQWNTLCCLPIEKPIYSNLSLDNLVYQQSGPDSYVYKVFKVNSSAIRNRIVMFNTQTNSSFSLIKARKHIKFLTKILQLNKNLNVMFFCFQYYFCFKGIKDIYDSMNMSFIQPTNLVDFNSTCQMNYTCELDAWYNSYHVVLNGQISKTPRPQVDQATLAAFVHNPTLITNKIETAIETMYPAQSVDVFLNCDKVNINSPTQEFFNRLLTKMHLSTGLDELGDLNWEMILCLFLVFLTVYFALWKGVKSAGKVFDHLTKPIHPFFP